MHSKLIPLIGAIFIMLSGLLYTIERAATNIASHEIIAGFLAGNGTGAVPEPKTAEFTDNFFVPLFAIIGIALIIYSGRRKNIRGLTWKKL
ncbi:hypothetical protein [Paenibacillus sp. GCM10027626]|uniref:hypothetical protein n=1 Tax=Paenibacillus sp. GCM10027626 TaxID=3273411 RepID=UPI003637A7ED